MSTVYVTFALETHNKGGHSSAPRKDNAIYQLADLSPTQNQRAAAQDPTLGEHRVKIMVSSQYSPAFDIAEAMAKWEKGRRIGRAQAAMLTCDA